MKQEKRTHPTRHKTTLDKYMKKESTVNLEAKRNLKKIKGDIINGEKNKKEVEVEEKTYIHNIQEFFVPGRTSCNFNISRTQHGLSIRPADPIERNPILPPGYKSRIEVLNSVNSLATGPDNNLYNMLTVEGFLANLRAEEAAQQRAKQKPVSCNCKKTHCLKMYCECISKGLYCNSQCQCKDCHNNSVHESQRQKSKDKMVFKKNNSMKELNDDSSINKSCNCKKSGCNKKYCQCFGAGAKCSALCRCAGCKNKDPTEQKPEEYKPQPPFNLSLHAQSNNPYLVNESNFFPIGNESNQNRSLAFGVKEQSQQLSRQMGFSNYLHNNLDSNSIHKK